jgi:multiple sugar transport system permease protein
MQQVAMGTLDAKLISRAPRVGKKGNWTLVTNYILLSVLGLMLIIPFVWMLSTSLKNPGNEFFYPPQWIPNPLTFNNYVTALSRMDFLLSYWNSVKVAVLTVIPTVFLTSAAAYAFVKLKFPGRNALFFVVIMLIMVPQEVTLIPNLLLMKLFGWLDTHTALIVPNIFGSGAVFALFIMRQNILSLPDSLIESGKIDGANHFQIYSKLIFPLTKSAVATVSIFTLMNSWNDFLYPLVYLNSTSKYTLPLSIAMFQQAYGMTEWTVWMAAATVSVLPLLIAYLFAQKQFISSMALTGIK